MPLLKDTKYLVDQFLYSFVDHSMRHFQQIRQSPVTTDMTEKALGKLSDGLKQALEEAQATQTEHLEQFMQNQTLELKQTVQDSVAKGAREVVEKLEPKLDMIQKELSEHGKRL